MTVIGISPHRWGWKAFEAPGVEPVFPKKEHREVQEQKATMAQLKSGMEALTATVKEQAAQLQKVSAQLEASKPAPQVVRNTD